jgi:flagellum-specific ATP synthase
VLDRKLASRGHFPAIDVLNSTSRVQRAVTTPQFIRTSRKFRELMAIYRDAEDLINIGAYKNGANPQIDEAIRVHPAIIDYLRQEVDEATGLEACEQMMSQIVGG